MTEPRLTINPDPLKVVSHRMGDGAGPARNHLVCKRLSRSGTVRAASIHEEGCALAPADGTTLRDNSTWGVKVCTPDETQAAFAALDEAGVEVSISCRRCGGWLTAPPLERYQS